MSEKQRTKDVQAPKPTAAEPDKTTRIRRLFSARDLRATTIGWEIAIPIIGGALLGFMIDHRYVTSPRWTLALLGVGLLSAVAAVSRYVKYEFYMMNREMEEQKAAELEKMKALIREQERRRKQRYKR